MGVPPTAECHGGRFGRSGCRSPVVVLRRPPGRPGNAGGWRAARNAPGCGRWRAGSRRWDTTRSRRRRAGVGPAQGRVRGRGRGGRGTGWSRPFGSAPDSGKFPTGSPHRQRCPPGGPPATPGWPRSEGLTPADRRRRRRRHGPRPGRRPGRHRPRQHLHLRTLRPRERSPLSRGRSQGHALAGKPGPRGRWSALGGGKGAVASGCGPGAPDHRQTKERQPRCHRYLGCCPAKASFTRRVCVAPWAG